MENIDKYEKVMGIILNEIDTRNIENRFNISIQERFFLSFKITIYLFINIWYNLIIVKEEIKKVI